MFKSISVEPDDNVRNWADEDPAFRSSLCLRNALRFAHDVVEIGHFDWVRRIQALRPHSELVWLWREAADRGSTFVNAMNTAQTVVAHVHIHNQKKKQLNVVVNFYLHTTDDTSMYQINVVVNVDGDVRVLNSVAQNA